MQIEIIYAAIITGVASILGVFLGIYGKNWFGNKENLDKDEMKETILQVATIEMELLEIRESMKSDRVWISQFHNGGHFYPTGKSIKKFSMFYEVVSKGTQPASPIFKNIPCSLYSNLFSKLMTTEGIKLPKLDGSVDDYGIGSAANATSTKSTYIIPLYTLDEKFIGTFGIDYVTDMVELSDDDWSSLKQRAYRIAGFLSSYLHEK